MVCRVPKDWQGAVTQDGQSTGPEEVCYPDVFWLISRFGCTVNPSVQHSLCEINQVISQTPGCVGQMSSMSGLLIIYGEVIMVLLQSPRFDPAVCSAGVNDRRRATEGWRSPT